MLRKAAVLIAAAISLSGCNDGNYIIKHQTFGTAAMVAVDGSIRSVLVNGGGKFCSEPPPDAIGTIAKIIAAKALTKASTKGVTGEASGEFNESVVTQIHDLFQRSQGVQVLRDGMYRLCEAFVNGAINQEIYAQQMIDLISTLDFVVPMELCVKLSSEERREGRREQPKMKQAARQEVPTDTAGTSAPKIESGSSNEVDRSVIFVESSKRVPEELTSKCFQAAYNYAYDHNQAIVKREQLRQEAEKAIALRTILQQK